MSGDQNAALLFSEHSAGGHEGFEPGEQREATEKALARGIQFALQPVATNNEHCGVSVVTAQRFVRRSKHPLMSPRLVIVFQPVSSVTNSLVST